MSLLPMYACFGSAASVPGIASQSEVHCRWSLSRRELCAELLAHFLSARAVDAAQRGEPFKKTEVARIMGQSLLDQGQSLAEIGLRITCQVICPRQVDVGQCAGIR